MRPILSYYGGKQRLAGKIVQEIDKIPHSVYVEPFAGGAAVLFKKPARQVSNKDHYREVINDIDNDLTTFYRVAITRRSELETKIKGTLHSRAEYERAKAVMASSDPDELDQAWAFWVLITCSFANKYKGSYAYSRKKENHAATVRNKRERITEQLKRLESVYIENGDALDIIKRWDSPQTLFYCDTPYVGTNQGAYSGYSLSDYRDLIATLESIQGAYLLSHYALDELDMKAGYIELAASVSAAHTKHAAPRKQAERLYSNTYQAAGS